MEFLLPKLVKYVSVLINQIALGSDLTEELMKSEILMLASMQSKLVWCHCYRQAFASAAGYWYSS